MGFAEQKVELFRIVSEADEEMTGKLIDFARSLEGKAQFTDEELKKFHESREQYLQHPETAMLMEDAHEFIRSLKRK